MRRFPSTAIIAVTLLSTVMSVRAAAQDYGLTTDTGTVGDMGSPGSKKWVTLLCQPGQYVVGAYINQGGWVAKFEVVCAAPNVSGGWAGDPVEGSAAGGENGSHDATLVCPRDTWVTGLSGRITTVRYGALRDTYTYLADPTLRCTGRGSSNSVAISDQEFQKEQRKNINSAKYADSPARYCATGAVASAVIVAVGGKNHPDIRAAKLRCARLAGA